jgi:hypothetical protein
MKLILILYLFTIFSSKIIAAENNLVIQGTKNLPIEISVALDGLQPSPLAQEDFNTLKDQVTRLEELCAKLTKEEIFFIAKVEFYKAFLTAPSLTKKNYFDETVILNLTKAAAKTNDTFLEWFLNALIQDANSLTKLPLYREYIAARTLGKIEKNDLKKIDRKVQIISSWMQQIPPENPEAVLKITGPLLRDILNRIELNFFLMATLSKTPAAVVATKNTSLTYFSIGVAAKKEPKIVTQQKSVEEIIDSVDGPAIQSISLPKPSSEDWLENNDDSPRLKGQSEAQNAAELIEDI